jgi:tetratricopeptide (TPR) repeat protein
MDPVRYDLVEPFVADFNERPMSQSINAKLRASHLIRLVEGIRVIGPEFERFGGIFIEQLLGIPLTHRGLNVLGFPVGGDVDTHSPDGAWVAEYSAETNYFASDMPKATNDLNHALAKKPSAREIVLLSAQKRVIAAEGRFMRKVRARREMKGRTLRIWDSEDIAASIVDHLLTSDRAVSLLSPYLPVLEQLRDEQAATLQVPSPVEGALVRSTIDAAFEAELKKSPCMVVSGHGGAGKSVAAAAFAKRHFNAYHNQIWLKGTDVPSVESLNAVAMVRAGDSRNVTYLLKSRPTLLIIDDADPNLVLNQLAALCGPGSHIIVTSRRGGGYILPPFDETEAREVVNRDTVEPCPGEVFRVIWDAVGGHPLTYGLINGAVRNGTSWIDIREDCRVIGELPDKSDHLANRLLARVLNAMRRELAFFLWVGKADCDRAFAARALNPVGLRKLSDACLTTPDRTNVVRLHDVVFASLQTLAVDLPDLTVAFSNELATYIEESATSGDGLPFWAASRSLDARLRAAIAAGDRRSAFVYALLVTSPPAHLSPDLLEDPTAMVNRILATSYDKVSAIDTMAVIETIEAGYLYRKIHDGKVAAKAVLALQMPVFNLLKADKRLSLQQQEELEHHRGKALLRLDDRSGAIACFETVLNGPRPLNETRLQLVKLLARDPEKATELETMTRALLEGFGGRGEVTTSVFLAVVEGLPWGNEPWRDDLIKAHGTTIEDVLVRLTSLGIGQAYRTLASIGRYWARREDPAFLRVFDMVPPREPDAADEDGDLFAYGELLFEASRLKPGERDELQARALATYDALKSRDAYQTERVAELLIEMGRPQEALGLLEVLPRIEESAFGQHRLSRAYLALGRLSEAQAAIDLALQRLRRESFRPTFEAHARMVEAARAAEEN